MYPHIYNCDVGISMLNISLESPVYSCISTMAVQLWMWLAKKTIRTLRFYLPKSISINKIESLEQGAHWRSSYKLTLDIHVEYRCTESKASSFAAAPRGEDRIIRRYSQASRNWDQTYESLSIELRNYPGFRDACHGQCLRSIVQHCEYELVGRGTFLSTFNALLQCSQCNNELSLLLWRCRLANLFRQILRSNSRWQVWRGRLLMRPWLAGSQMAIFFVHLR